ncbi:unnamed protein product [Hermetia illucens]|uniref:PI-PLC X domain-containing protein 3 n=1 Tax=Hermetia illucens TaxID=343691 RepID=A0A7R8UDT0_HERIL|nr:uncharacterized protein LOC119647204 [Hermetia illucens]CAD7078867.1 unnamed protein product [Hermetia illucens]
MADPFLYRWMTNLDLRARNYVPIIYLAIPGSSNSTSYAVRWNSIPAPIKPWMNFIFDFLVGKFSVNRCKTQNLNVYEQLQNGVRYFDLQICKKSKTANPISGFYFCNGRYCDPVAEPLTLIKKYLESQRQEFVILDFKKFYNMKRFDHDTIQDFLFKLFGKSIFGPRNGFLLDLTLTKAAQMGKQVLIIYRNDNFWENAWPDYCWPLLSVKVDNVEDLCGALESKLKRRQPGTGCISGYIYKPRALTLTSYSRNALTLSSRIRQWLPQQSAGFVSLNAPRLNIITADFIDRQDAAFCKEVIRLNDWSLHTTQIKDDNESYV